MLGTDMISCIKDTPLLVDEKNVSCTFDSLIPLDKKVLTHQNISVFEKIKSVNYSFLPEYKVPDIYFESNTDHYYPKFTQEKSKDMVFEDFIFMNIHSAVLYLLVSILFLAILIGGCVFCNEKSRKLCCFCVHKRIVSEERVNRHMETVPRDETISLTSDYPDASTSMVSISPPADLLTIDEVKNLSLEDRQKYKSTIKNKHKDLTLHYRQLRDNTDI